MKIGAEKSKIEKEDQSTEFEEKMLEIQPLSFPEFVVMALVSTFLSNNLILLN